MPVLPTVPANARNRVRACLWGLANGERNGGPVRMALRLGQSLVQCRAFDAEDIFRRYRDWWRSGAFDTGSVFSEVMILIDRGCSRSEAVRMVDRQRSGRTGGVNPAHRVAPLACALFIPDRDLPALARIEAGLTHLSPLAGDVSSTTAVLLRALIRGESWEVAMEKGLEQAVCPETRELVVTAQPPLPEVGFAPEILANALYFVQNSVDFESALVPAMQHAGPANYSPVLVGAIAGARCGQAPEHPEHCGPLVNSALADLFRGL